MKLPLEWNDDQFGERNKQKWREAQKERLAKQFDIDTSSISVSSPHATLQGEPSGRTIVDMVHTH